MKPTPVRGRRPAPSAEALLDIQPEATCIERPIEEDSRGAARSRRGCAFCDCRHVVARLLWGGVWLGSRSAPHALPERCSFGCMRLRRPFTCCMRQRFKLVDDELELHLKACDYYQTFQEGCQPAANTALAPRYRFEMRLRPMFENTSSNARRHSKSAAFSVVGNIQLRLGYGKDLEHYAGHLGYYVSPAHRGRRFALRSCLLLLELARWHGMSTIWITCNPDNLASRRTAERLGAACIETVELPSNNPQRLQSGDAQKCRYRLSL